MGGNVWPLMAAVLLAACQPAEDPAVVAARQAAEREAAAAPTLAAYKEALAAENWEAAFVHADFLHSQHPQTEAAKTVQPQLAELESKVKRLRAERRLAALWDYQRNPAGRGEQVTAAIDASNRVEVGHGRSSVKLIFRDHPEWGRSSYLVLERGDFNCYRGCTLKLTVDGKPRTLRGSRPDTDEAIAMFITDERALWRLFKSASEVTIEFPVKPSGTVTARYETAGLDPARMPGW